MSIQYITDENGRRTAVVLPVEEFEALLLDEPAPGGHERLTPAEEAERRLAYEELARGEALDLGEAMKEW